MKFGIHNPSWLFGPDPYEMFEALKKKVQWVEANGFNWFSLMDHLIQIPFVGAADEPFMEGWSTLSALAAVTSKIRLATLVTSVAYRNPAHLAKIAAGDGNKAFYEAKLVSARYWMERMIPECPMLLERIQAGSETIMKFA